MIIGLIMLIHSRALIEYSFSPNKCTAWSILPRGLNPLRRHEILFAAARLSTATFAINTATAGGNDVESSFAVTTIRLYDSLFNL